MRPAGPTWPVGAGVPDWAVYCHGNGHTELLPTCCACCPVVLSLLCSKVVEHAGLPHLTPEERRRHLNFVVVSLN